MTIITLKQIVQMFRDFSANHLLINDFGFGPTSDIGTSKQMDFPYLWVTTSESSSIDYRNRTMIPKLRFGFLFLDQINIQPNTSTENGLNTDNQEDILSDQFQVLQDFLTYVTTLSKYGIILEEQSITTQPMLDETTDKVSGWYITLVIAIKHSNCIYSSKITPIQ